jgi:hypothetical protein
MVPVDWLPCSSNDFSIRARYVQIGNPIVNIAQPRWNFIAPFYRRLVFFVYDALRNPWMNMLLSDLLFSFPLFKIGIPGRIDDLNDGFLISLSTSMIIGAGMSLYDSGLHRCST